MKSRPCRNCGTFDEPIVVFCVDCIRAWAIGLFEALGAAVVGYLLWLWKGQAS